MADMNRRQLIKAGAWAAPVIVLATAAPAAAVQSVTPCKSQTYIFDPVTTSFDSGRNDVAKITVITGQAIIIQYIRTTDIQDINVHKASGDINLHVDGAVPVSRIVTIPLKSCEDPTFIQVHGNNIHYYGNGRFA